MDSRRSAIIDTWLLAVANFAIFQGLMLFDVDRLASDHLWQLGYLTASVFCFAFWLVLGAIKWWHRVGQTLLVVSTPLIVMCTSAPPSASASCRRRRRQTSVH